MSLLNTTVTAGQVIGWAGSTGPGGCGCTDGTKNTNTHLHIFFAFKDPTDNHTGISLIRMVFTPNRIVIPQV